MSLQALIQQAKGLSVKDRKALIMAMLETFTESESKPKRSAHTFEGVGEHLRDDTLDAQDYVNQMRDEWDQSA